MLTGGGGGEQRRVGRKSGLWGVVWKETEVFKSPFSAIFLWCGNVVEAVGHVRQDWPVLVEYEHSSIYSALFKYIYIHYVLYKNPLASLLNHMHLNTRVQILYNTGITYEVLLTASQINMNNPGCLRMVKY